MRTALIATLAFVVAFGSSATAQNCQIVYGQCGGIGWNSPNCCNSGSYCTTLNPYYAQCTPGSGPEPTAVSETTTEEPTTTTFSEEPTTTEEPTSDPTSEAPSDTTTLSEEPTAEPTAEPTSDTTSEAPSATTTSPEPTTTAGPPPAGVTPYTAPDLGAEVSGNPYQGLQRFVNADYVAEVDASIQANADDTDFTAAATRMRQYPSFKWIDQISAISYIQPIIDQASAQSGGSEIIVELVIYDLPGRDCAALASNGELPAGSLNRYKAEYIDVIAKIFKAKPSNIRLVLVIEPDSLPNLATNIGRLNCNSVTQSEYPEGVAYAIANLCTIDNTFCYVDAAHGGWLGWADNTQKMVAVMQNVLSRAKSYNSAATIRGFATSVSNYSPFDAKGVCPAQEPGKCQTQNGQLVYDFNPCIDENTYTKQLASVWGGAGLPARFIVDTSRSGQVGIRKVWGSWCNIKGAGVGPRPATNPAGVVDAFVWVKPPGESDGVSGPPGTPRLDGFCDPTTSNGIDSLSGAPQAGQWFDAQFVMLVKNANPPL
ncbi:1, 4-beta cellobiohydrolase [Cladochytrium replicatum]|nr:1, 4-beta cellobiohydrolase [Cladochytrium replicatum]